MVRILTYSIVSALFVFGLVSGSAAQVPDVSDSPVYAGTYASGYDTFAAVFPGSLGINPTYYFVQAGPSRTGGDRTIARWCIFQLNGSRSPNNDASGYQGCCWTVSSSGALETNTLACGQFGYEFVRDVNNRIYAAILYVPDSSSVGYTEWFMYLSPSGGTSNSVQSALSALGFTNPSP